MILSFSLLFISYFSSVLWSLFKGNLLFFLSVRQPIFLSSLEARPPHSLYLFLFFTTTLKYTGTKTYIFSSSLPPFLCIHNSLRFFLFSATVSFFFSTLFFLSFFLSFFRYPQKSVLLSLSLSLSPSLSLQTFPFVFRTLYLSLNFIFFMFVLFRFSIYLHNSFDCVRSRQRSTS